uniref:Uncharacterized protein n=1 Tax=Stomoxys calcitrans TaxID=35570 RepID=A0A1I8PLK4_STOCA
MSTFNSIHFLFGALFLFSAANLTQADNKRLEMSVMTNFINVMEEQIDVMRCMERSCDPLVFEKMLQNENDVESNLQAQSPFSETNELKSEKVAKAVQRSVAKYLLIEPLCQDTSYSCPIPVYKEIPKDIADYINAIQGIVTNGRKCINFSNIDKAINILGEGVEYVEEYRTHSGTSMQRVLPACLHCSNGFNQLCDAATTGY